MPAPRDHELLVAAARLYYLDNRSQREVATELGISRPNVSRILAAAREQGIVEIRVHDPARPDGALEDELKSAFNLQDCRVASVRPGEEALNRVGDLGARWLLEQLRPGQLISLSWGKTLQAMVWAAQPEHTIPVEVVPLVGGLSSVTSEITGEELVRELANRLGATFRRLHAPALLESGAARDTLLAESSISSVLDAATRSSLAVVGVGAAGRGSSAAVIEALDLTLVERTELDKARPVGDVCARFFDADGQSIGGGVHDRVLSVSLEELRQIPAVVGLAADVEKAQGVLGALRGGILNVLICDSRLARAVLAAAESSHV